MATETTIFLLTQSPNTCDVNVADVVSTLQDEPAATAKSAMTSNVARKRIAAENANEMQNVPPSSSAGVCVLIALHSPVESSSGFRMHPASRDAHTAKNTNGKVS